MDASISTSGDYEQFVERDGLRYHHVVDPRTGFPARCGLVSATVIARDPVEADVLSTAIFACGRDRAEDLLKLTDHASAILIGADGRVSHLGDTGWPFAEAER